jgi:exopolysaccharide biosynthesis polyprenyl glycosylphosphotransferase
MATPHRHVPQPFLWLIDLAALAISFGCAYALWPAARAWAVGQPELANTLRVAMDPLAERQLQQQIGLLAGLAPVTLMAVHLLGGYGPVGKLSRVRTFVAGLFGPLLGLAALILVAFALGVEGWSRLLLFSYTAFASVLLLTTRFGIRGYLRSRAKRGLYARATVVIGSPPVVQRVIEHFAKNVPVAAHRIIGYLSVSGDEYTAEQPAVRCLGAVDELGHLLVNEPIQDVIAVLPAAGDSQWVHAVIGHCDYFRVTLRIVPEALLAGQWRDSEILFAADQIRLPEVVLRPREIDSSSLFLKRVFDIVVSAALLVVLSPLFLVIAALIKLTTPKLTVFYPWRVVGYHGRLFTGYKFTTMDADLDASQNALLSQNEMTGPVFKMKADPRVTPLGRVLRKFSLNELPQLWSVLRGDMSLVGPRPAFPHELRRYELWHKRKLAVKPGITCLWQVRGRNAISNFDDWVRMDLEYIDNWSLWLDLKILIRTAWAVVAGTGS